jgi:hypothetical protein
MSERPLRPSLPLTIMELRHRVINYGYTSYSNFQYLIKSGVFAIAALTIFNILAANNQFRSQRIALWLASLGFSLLTLSTWNRGSMLSNGKANIADSLFQLLMGVTEYLLFLILSPEVSKADGWVTWYIAAAGQGFFAAGLVWNRIRLTDVERDFAAELRDLGNQYRRWLRHDIIGAVSLSIVTLILFAITEKASWGQTRWFQYISAAMLLIGCVLAIMRAERQYNTAFDYVGQER